MTPLEAILRELHRQFSPPEVEPDAFVEAGFALARERGVTDSLTPLVQVCHPNDPTVNGELRIQLGREGAVLVRAYFAEAPIAACELRMPLKKFATLQKSPQSLFAPQAWSGIVDLLIQNGVRNMQAAQEEAQPRLKLEVPGG